MLKVARLQRELDRNARAFVLWLRNSAQRGRLPEREAGLFVGPPELRNCGCSIRNWQGTQASRSPNLLGPPGGGLKPPAMRARAAERARYRVRPWRPGRPRLALRPFGGAGGTLSGTGLSAGVGGVHSLSGTASAITSELEALVFTPNAGAPNTSSTTTFTLSDQSSAGGAPAVDTATTVIDQDPSLDPPPTIAGTASGQTTTSEAPVTPFASATIGDPNVGATDTLTITLGGAGGTLSGTGLSAGVGGVYSLSGTASAITSELEALVTRPTRERPTRPRRRPSGSAIRAAPAARPLSIRQRR